MDWLKDWIVWAWEFVAWIFRELGNLVIGTLFDVFPLQSWLSTSGVGTNLLGFRSVVDAWIPFTEGVGLMSALVAFQLVLITIKWVFKVIPGMGG